MVIRALKHTDVQRQASAKKKFNLVPVLFFAVQTGSFELELSDLGCVTPDSRPGDRGPQSLSVSLYLVWSHPSYNLGNSQLSLFQFFPSSPTSLFSPYPPLYLSSPV